MKQNRLISVLGEEHSKNINKKGASTLGEMKHLQKCNSAIYNTLEAVTPQK